MHHVKSSGAHWLVAINMQPSPLHPLPLPTFPISPDLNPIEHIWNIWDVIEHGARAQRPPPSNLWELSD